VATKFVASLYQFGYWAYLGGSLVADALYVTRDIVAVAPDIGYPIIAALAVVAGFYGARKEYQRITLVEDATRRQRATEREQKENKDTRDLSVEDMLKQHRTGLTKDQCREFLLRNPEEFYTLLRDNQVLTVLTPHFDITPRRRFTERGIVQDNSPVDRSQARPTGRNDDSPLSLTPAGYTLPSGLRQPDETHSARESKESPSVHFQQSSIEEVPYQHLPPSSGLLYQRSQPDPQRHAHISDRPNTYPQVMGTGPGLQLPAVARRGLPFLGSNYVPPLNAHREGIEQQSPATFMRGITAQPVADIRMDVSRHPPMQIFGSDGTGYGVEHSRRHSLREREIELSVTGTDAKFHGEYSQQHHTPSPDTPDTVLPQQMAFHRTDSANNRHQMFVTRGVSGGIHSEATILPRSNSFTRGSSG
jgi:hypothetical protein